MTESTIGVAMEILELERRLSELSASERRYRDEAPFDWSTMTERVEVDGRSVRKIGQIGAEYAQAGMPAGLMIRRNSRFSAVPEHVHDYVEISYVYRGHCPQTVAGEELVLERNEVLLLDAACPHAVAALGEDDIMLSMTVSRAFLRRSLESSLSRESAVSRFLFNALNSETDHRGHVRFRCGESRRVWRYMQEMLCELYDPSPNSRNRPASVSAVFGRAHGLLRARAGARRGGRCGRAHCPGDRNARLYRSRVCRVLPRGDGGSV